MAADDNAGASSPADSRGLIASTLVASLDPRPLSSRDDRREQTAAYIAYILLGTLIASIVATFAFALLRSTDDAKTLAEIFVPSLITLIGSVLGYYFGNRQLTQS